VTTKVEEYRARARECELRAGQVHDLEVRQQFLELARQWHHMAADGLTFWRNADDRLRGTAEEPGRLQNVYWGAGGELVCEVVSHTCAVLGC
jgi:hypothetical protein